MAKVRFVDNVGSTAFGNSNPNSLTTASAERIGVENVIKFTKGTGQTFTIPIVASASSNDAIISASVNLNSLTFQRGDATTINLVVDTGSLSNEEFILSLTKAGISGSFTLVSSSLADRIATNTSNFTILNTKTLISSSAQISDDISGSLGPNATLIRSLTATGISGSFTAASSSFSTRTTSLEIASGSFSTRVTNNSSSLSDRVTNVEEGSTSKTLISSSAQISDDISGSLGPNGSFIRTLTQTGISGSFIVASASLNEAVNNNTSKISSLTSVTGSYAITSSNVIFNHITASGNISASGTIIASIGESSDPTFKTVMIDPSTGQLFRTGSYGGGGGGSEFSRPGISGSLGPNQGFIRTLTQTGVSGSFTAASSSFSTRVTSLKTDSGSFSTRVTNNETNITTLQSNPTFTSTGISGSFNAASSSFSTRVTLNDAKLTANTSNVTLAGALMDSELTEISTVKELTKTSISGSFTAPSSSISTRITSLEAGGTFTSAGISGSLGSNATLIRSLTAIGISGSFTAASSSFASRTTTLEANPVFTSTGISGSFTAVSSSFSTRVTSLKTDSGSFSTRVTNLEGGGGSGFTAVGISGSLGTNATLIRSLTAAGISGSFTAASSSFSSRVTGLKTDSGSFASRTTALEANPVFTSAGISGSLGSNATLIRSLTATGISGSFTAASSSFSTRVTGLKTDSGSFSTRVTSLKTDSGSFSTRVAINESNIKNITSSLSTTGEVVFVGSNGTLSSDTGMTYDSTADRLTVVNLVTTTLTSSFITSSTIQTSGSNIFGDDTTDVQTLIGTTKITGSAQITGSLSVTSGNISGSFIGNGSGLTNLPQNFTAAGISGSFTIASSSFSTRVTGLKTDSGSFSTRVTDLKTDSGSFSTRVTNNETNITDLVTITGSYAITGSNNFIGDQNITGHITASSNISASGTINGLSGSFKSLDVFVNLPVTTDSKFRVGRDSVQYIGIGVSDYDNIILAKQDNDSPGHGNQNFILNRDFDGAGTNNFKIQKDGVDQFIIDTSGNIEASGNISASGHISASNLVLNNGSVTSPAIGFGTTNTGIFYNSGANSVAFTGAGATTAEFSNYILFRKYLSMNSNYIQNILYLSGPRLELRSTNGTITASADISASANIIGNQITSSNNIEIGGGLLSIRNQGVQSAARFYCEVSNAHYTELKAQPHALYSGNPVTLLPAYDFDFAKPNFTPSITASIISASGNVIAPNLIADSGSFSTRITNIVGFPFTGSATISGSLNVTGPTTSDKLIVSNISSSVVTNLPGDGSTISYPVTVVSGVYHIDVGSGAQATPSFTLLAGNTYRFTQEDGSNSGHRILFKKQSDGSNYTDGVTTEGSAGSSGGYTQIVVSLTTPSLKYYCESHGDSYGGSAVISINTTTSDVTSTFEIGELQASGSSNFTGSVNLSDNTKLKLGNAGDLEIYHDGNNSYIDDAGTGALFYRGGTQTFQNAAGSKTMATFNAANSVDLNYNSNTKFQTTNTGISITGDIVASGDISASGHISASDLDISASATIDGNLKLTQNNTNNPLIINNGAGTEIYFPGALETNITSQGLFQFKTSNNQGYGFGVDNADFKAVIGDPGLATTATTVIADTYNGRLILKGNANPNQISGSLIVTGSAGIPGFISASSFNATPEVINQLTASYAITASAAETIIPRTNFKPIVTHTADFTTSASFAGHYNVVGGNLQVTVTTASNDLVSGYEWDFFQTGSGDTFEFVAGTGVTIISRSNNKKLAAVGSAATLKYISGETFHLVGDLTT